MLVRAPWRTTFGLVALVTACLALATLAMGAIAYAVMHEALEVQLDHRVAVETQALLDEAGRGGIRHAIARREEARSTASLDYLLVDRTGRRLAGSLDATAPAAPGYVELMPYGRDGRMRVAQSLTTRLADGSRLVVAADRAVIDEMDATLVKLFAGTFGVMLLLGIVAAWVVGAVTRARLARIDRTARAIIAGDLGRRMPLAGTGDEFDRVALTLNRMLDRIGALMDNLRQVSSDVAHDLRTPLTRLHNRLDEALAGDDPIARREAVIAAASQSRELLDIFASLLRIAEVEALPPSSHFKDVSFDLLVAELVETYRADFDASGHRLVVDIKGAAIVRGDRRLLQQMVTNLFDNALRHTPAGTTVHVTLDRAAGARLSVADDGPGVAAGDAPRLFQRFARAERSRSTDGHGLGLAMVAAIASAHGGGATLQPSAGFRIVVNLPAAT